jgi:hypothetical protein
VVVASLYGLTLAIARPIADSLLPAANALLIPLLWTSTFIASAVLGLCVALGLGSWSRRLLLGLMVWLTVMVLYYTGLGHSANPMQGEMLVPSTICTFLFAVLSMSLARVVAGWRVIDCLAEREGATSFRFSMMQLMFLVLVCAAASVILRTAVRETPSWLSWQYFEAVGLQPSALWWNVLFCILALPWILAAFGGWRAARWAFVTTLATSSGIVAFILYVMLPRTGGNWPTEFVVYAVVLSWLPPLPSYLLALGLRGLGMRIEWHSTTSAT